ncbi:hypothetical protein ARMSODRAFT_948061 [Armillaria solidipes]|uniref:Uncharacterized protein n=1 Tax=Armillaria solidipes TaxID=1076256 RepID=A0A2H3BZJ9_9AGAR|nr:hypothetical protein ARMSODRAFT_948061 [Armillaria solidipes]
MRMAGSCEPDIPEKADTGVPKSLVNTIHKKAAIIGEIGWVGWRDIKQQTSRRVTRRRAEGSFSKEGSRLGGKLKGM